MNRRGRYAAWWLLLALTLSEAPADPEPPLTTEAVVQMYARGLPQETILGEISARQVDFDLDDEMLAELRAAGLPAVLIQAMLDRTARERVAAGPREAPAQAPGPPRLRVLFNPDRRDGKPELLRLTGEELDRFAEDGALEDVAIFLACLTPTHVPDHWRAQSALGRDFDGMPRHRLLAFVGGAAHRERSGEPDQLELAIPPELEVELQAGVEHDLMLGIAVEFAGRYRHMANDRWAGFVLEGPREIRAEISSWKRPANLGRLAVRFDKPTEPDH